MAKTILHPASSRGHVKHDWLETYHSFSFASYHDPAKVHFGVLRVLNDDSVDGGMGFGMHPHDNMEIITIPIEGDLEHKDSMGNHGIIKQGDVQVMSAGTGIYHSEVNPNPDKVVKLFQIWVFPNKKNVTPRYDQITLNPEDRKNKFQQIVSPNPEDEGTWIHQNAWFNLGHFDKGQHVNYSVKANGNGVYAFIIKGEATINGQSLKERDALGIWETETLSIETDTEAEILLMDIPMN